MTRYLIDAQRRWVALVRGGAVLMQPVSDGELIDDLWAALEATQPTGAVLGRLTRDGLADLAPFALVVPDARGLRVVVRGGFRVRVAGEAVTGADVSTWVERAFPGADAFEVLAPFANPAAGDRGWPIVEGIVAASAVSAGTEVDAEPASAPAPVTAVTAADTTAIAVEGAPAPGPGGVPEATLIPEQTVHLGTTAVSDDTIVAAREASDDEIEDRTIVVERPVRPAAAAPAPVDGVDGDHDGRTIVVEDLQRLRRDAKAKADGPAAATATAGGGTATATVAAVRLRLPDGTEEVLAGEFVLGRSPSIGRTSGTRLPRLITVGVGDPDISRSHVRIGLEGGTIVVTDLHSRNGTHVVQPGRAPVKLRAGEPTPVLAGTVVDLGGGCVIAVVEA